MLGRWVRELVIHFGKAPPWRRGTGAYSDCVQSGCCGAAIGGAAEVLAAEVLAAEIFVPPCTNDQGSPSAAEADSPLATGASGTEVTFGPGDDSCGVAGAGEFANGTARP